MEFYRIQAFPQETLYVLADQGRNLSFLANDRACFSPVSFSIEKVCAGDIPAMAKLVIVDPLVDVVKRVNLETAIRVAENRDYSAADDICAALVNLREAMRRNGLNGPSFIQLENKEEAMKIASMFSSLIQYNHITEDGDRPTGNSSIFVMGVELRWSDATSQGKADGSA